MSGRRVARCTGPGPAENRNGMWFSDDGDPAGSTQDGATGARATLRRIKVAIDYADNAEYIAWAKEASVSRHSLGLTPARP